MCGNVTSLKSSEFDHFIEFLIQIISLFHEIFYFKIQIIKNTCISTDIYYSFYLCY